MIDWGQVWVALAVGVPSLIIGVMAHRRSVQVDAASEQSGAASNNRAGYLQVQVALESLIDTYQEDTKGFRDEIKYLVARLDVVTKERDDLRLEVARLRKRYGVNGENGPPA